jgi:hypothetical protein
LKEEKEKITSQKLIRWLALSFILRSTHFARGAKQEDLPQTM